MRGALCCAGGPPPACHHPQPRQPLCAGNAWAGREWRRIAACSPPCRGRGLACGSGGSGRLSFGCLCISQSAAAGPRFRGVQSNQHSCTQLLQLSPRNRALPWRSSSAMCCAWPRRAGAGCRPGERRGRMQGAGRSQAPLVPGKALVAAPCTDDCGCRRAGPSQAGALAPAAADPSAALLLARLMPPPAPLPLPPGRLLMPMPACRMR